MTLELIPNSDLIFKGPFNVVSTTTLKLSNSGNERLAYKIKTTAPKRYCVKPNSGFLESHTTANIQVMLQPQAPGQPDDRTKHKFMVQWVAVPNTHTEDVDNFWKQDVKSLNVQDSKLKCIFADEQQPSAIVPNDSHGFRELDAPMSRADAGHDLSKSRLKQEIDRLKDENEAMKERLKQQENSLRQRTTGSSPVAERFKTHQQQKQNGPVLFGIAINQQLVLVAFVIALLFGFSLGYFLFSCSN